ncbi:MAG: NUDIX domain-containing protein [Parvularculaceae bacterium]
MSGDSLSIPAHTEHYSVVLLKEAGGAFLLQRRASGKGLLYAGRIGLFGGRREGDEMPEATAVREIAEECGVALKPAKLTLLARLLAQDERGVLSLGHIYFSEDLEREAVRAALKFRSDEGKGVLLSPAGIGRRSAELTSISLYALSAFADFGKARAPARPRGLAMLWPAVGARVPGNAGKRRIS